MTKTSKPTSGPWSVNNTTLGTIAAGKVIAWHIASDKYGSVRPICAYTLDKDEDTYVSTANAALIAEAGTVYHDTGLSPRELADHLRTSQSLNLEGAQVIDELRAERNALKDSRAELLVALQGLVEQLGLHRGHPNPPKRIIVALEAISKHATNKGE